jgi:hypothetical protein
MVYVVACEELLALPAALAGVLEVRVEDLPRLHELGRTADEWSSLFIERHVDATFRQAYEIVAARFAELFVAAHDVLFQKRPALRTQFPGAIILARHRDGGVQGHQDEETNVWAPMVPVKESSTIWIQDEENGLRPWVCDVGEALVFPGAILEHESHPNETDATRVSLDFRLLPAEKLRPGGWTEDGSRRFELGVYWQPVKTHGRRTETVPVR